MNNATQQRNHGNYQFYQQLRFRIKNFHFLVKRSVFNSKIALELKVWDLEILEQSLKVTDKFKPFWEAKTAPRQSFTASVKVDF